jgi:hypothetical protein
MDHAAILASIHGHRLEVRRIVYALRRDASIARKNGLAELADKAESLADALTEALKTHQWGE